MWLPQILRPQLFYISLGTLLSTNYIFSGLSYHNPNNFREGYVCVHVNKTCVLELQLPRQHLHMHFYFIFCWVYIYEEGQNPFVHAQFIYSFVLSARLVKTCQWTFKGSIVIHKITAEGGSKCCLRYWIVGAEPVMQLLFGYIFRWLIISTNPCFESWGVWSLNLLNTRKEIIFKNTIILRNPPFGSVSNVMQACTNDKSGKMSKHCNPISYFTMNNEMEAEKFALFCNSDKENGPWN